MQVPPQFSAVHVDGKRAYQSARKGMEVEIPPRKITIFNLEVLDMALPRVSLKIHCSKGTYIRSLARDIGRECGSAAYLSSLRRTSVGPFNVEKASAPREVQPEKDLVSPSKLIRSLGVFQELTLLEEHEKDVHFGRPLKPSFFVQPPQEEGLYALSDNEGVFMALLDYQKGRISYRFNLPR